MTMTFPLAETPDAALREKGRLLFAQQTDFLKGVVAIDGLPADDRIEICFAGRSNVGKSTLINALTGRKALARTSNTPGRTQEINFFTAADSLYLVDLPGYGYANAPLPVVEKWQRLLKPPVIRVDRRNHAVMPVLHQSCQFHGDGSPCHVCSYCCASERHTFDLVPQSAAMIIKKAHVRRRRADIDSQCAWLVACYCIDTKCARTRHFTSWARGR